jgi:C4-type Zn-finger protein
MYGTEYSGTSEILGETFVPSYTKFCQFCQYRTFNTVSVEVRDPAWSSQMYIPKETAKKDH